MAKSRVEKNKDLYNDIELKSFEVEDLKEKVKETPTAIKEEKKHDIVKLDDEKKEETKEKVEEVELEQPLSYTDKLSIEEILRAKLEKQQKLKNSKRLEKRTPFTEEYDAEKMQKNINQASGVDVRKEVNIKIRKNNNAIIFVLLVLLVLVLIGGGIALYYALR